MNPLIIKRASIFSAILGAFIGIFALVPSLVGFAIFILSFISSIIVILYMKRNDKYLGIISNEQGAILGGVIGFCATIGFGITFSPLVYIISLIFKSYYSYTIPDMINQALWLFFVLLFMSAFIFALTNAVTAMGLTWILGYIETKPENSDAPLDIEIND